MSILVIIPVTLSSSSSSSRSRELARKSNTSTCSSLLKKSINVIDATFGGGGYSKTILEKFNVNQLLAIDRDPISKIFAKELESKFSNFILINDKFSNIEEIVNKIK